MKRRNVIVASVAMANLVRSARAAGPCTSSGASGAVGRSSSTADSWSAPCPATASAAASRYVTRFEQTENPLSHGGRWINGKTIGLDWHDAKSVGGVAQASALSGISHRYDDSIAVLTTTFTPNQYAQGTVFRAAAYSPPSKHEIELLLRFQISEHSARGYEVLWADAGAFAVVRWNGRLGDFTVLAATDRPELGGDGPGPGLAIDGDVLRAEIVGEVVRVYKNGGLVFVAPPNDTWKTGQPGLGFWPTPGSVPQRYGWKAYEAGSLL
jgi:hypothetical protein